MRFKSGLVLLTLMVLCSCSTLRKATIEQKNSPINGGNGSAGQKSIGYIGFLGDQEWVLQFNDCTVYRFIEAEKFLWFDRSL